MSTAVKSKGTITPTTNKKSATTKPRAKKRSKYANKAEIISEAFTKELLSNGFNGTKAYETIKPHVTNGTARVAASRLLAKDNVRQRILTALHDNGVDELSISKKLKTMLDKTPDNKQDAWVLDRAIVHSRAILGLDADKKVHKTIDKRTMNVTAQVDQDFFSTLIKNSK